MSNRLIEVKFTCNKCGADDTLKLFPDESIPATVNCWKCHAGFHKDIAEMISTGVGMFPPKELLVKRGTR
jgi:hypothetical protein